MRVLLAALAVLALSGCLDDTADHATIHNEGSEPVDLQVTFTSPQGSVLHEDSFTLESGRQVEFPLDRSGDGTHHLLVEAADGRSTRIDLHWQGSTGPNRVQVIVHEDRIEEMILT